MGLIEELKNLREASNVMDKLNIINKLSTYKDLSIIYPILEVVKDGNKDLINAVSDSLKKMNYFATPTLKNEITNKNCFLRWTVALAIQKIGDPIYIKYLIPALGIGYNPVIDTILKALSELEPKRFPEPNLQKVFKVLDQSEKDSVGYYAIRQLGNQALDSMETIFALITLKKLHWQKSIVPSFKVLIHPDYRVHRNAENILREFEIKEIFNECKKVIDNPDFYEEKYDFFLQEPNIHDYNHTLHYYAIKGLGYIANKSEKARDELWNIFRNGSKMEKIFAIRAMGEFNHKSKNEIVLSSEIKMEISKLLKDLEGNNKLDTIQLLGKFGEEWAFSTISAFLNDANPRIRLAVLNSLSNSKKTNILDKIAYLLVDKNKKIRKATVRLFEKFYPNFFKMRTSEGNIIDKLPKQTKKALLEILVKGLNEGDEKYREFAAFWLGTLNYSPAYEALINNLHHPTESVVYSVITSFGIFGATKAIPHLIPFIYDIKSPRIRRKAIETIGMLGENDEGLQELIHQLYLKEKKNPPYLEKYILSHGPRVMNYLEGEIEFTKDKYRKIQLTMFYQKVTEQFQIKKSDDFKILL